MATTFDQRAHPTHARPNLEAARNCPRERGFSLLELMVAISLLAIGLMGLVASMASSITYSGISGETRIAMRAIANQIETMQAQMVPLAAANVSAFVSQTSFAVSGLPPKANGSAASGTISFLTEAQANAYWGSSVGVDLDMNGTSNETKVPSTTTPWQAYAVKLTVTWGDRTAAGANRSIDVYTIIFDRGG